MLISYLQIAPYTSILSVGISKLLTIYLAKKSTEDLFIDSIKGVWLDQFYSTWFDKEILLNYLNMNIKVCVVSSELNGRNYSLCWSVLKEIITSDEKNKGNLMLCTDIPDKAKEYFYE